MVADFTPPTRSTYDYFLKIDSTLKPDGVYYHDMNGYLVSQRKVGQRLDYNWKYKKEDKINANTYPMCSFGYILQDDKKVFISLLSWLSLLTGPKDSPYTTIACWSTSTDWPTMTTRESDKGTTSSFIIPSDSK